MSKQASEIQAETETSESASEVLDAQEHEEIAGSEAEETVAEEIVSQDLDGASRELADDDDDLLLAAHDSRLDGGDSFEVFKQEEGVVSWSIAGLYDSNGNTYPKRELRANPPLLTVESSNGDKAEFILTKDFSGGLSRVLERVHYGYFGQDRRPKKSYTWASAKQSIVDAIGRKPLQIGAVLLLSVILVIGLVAN